jgi:hypothetical protein
MYKKSTRNLGHEYSKIQIEKDRSKLRLKKISGDRTDACALASPSPLMLPQPAPVGGVPRPAERTARPRHPCRKGKRRRPWV